MVLNGVGIRRAAEVDLLALIELTEAQGSPEPVYWRKQWQQRLLNPEVFTYLAEDEQLFGFVSAGPAELLDKTDGEVIALFLAPKYRGLGMGKKLLVRGLSVLKRRNYNRGVVFIDEDTAALKQIIVALGFERGVGDREVNYPGGTLRQQGYALDLNDYF
tara:strand:+ start:4940 stop:5419 length:480 start_codon:yes stop_codon:yes gene_type:complete